MRRRIAGIGLLLVSAGAGCTAARTAGAGGAPAVVRTDDRRTLAEFVARVRAVSREAGTARAANGAVALEDRDPRLRAALAALAVHPDAARHKDVAAAYREAGIADRAFDHYTRAVRLNRTDAGAYDGLARVWRDWGWPHLALPEAHRAVYDAPDSAAARNTLGTVLQALGHVEAAREAYQAAIRLDAGAGYAVNNLCALDLEAGRLDAASAACQRAIDLDPSLLAARRNLALARGAASRGPATHAERAPDRPSDPVPAAATPRSPRPPLD